jgi:hypothetical protein
MTDPPPRRRVYTLSPEQARVALNVFAGLENLLAHSVVDEHQLALLTLSHSIQNPAARRMLRGALTTLQSDIRRQLRDDDGAPEITEGPWL